MRSTAVCRTSTGLLDRRREEDKFLWVSAQMMDPTMEDETVKIPIVCLRFDVPTDGLPVMEDWLTTFESILFRGLELGREPLDVCMKPDGGVCSFSFKIGCYQVRGHAPSALLTRSRGGLGPVWLPSS